VSTGEQDHRGIQGVQGHRGPKGDPGRAGAAGDPQRFQAAVRGLVVAFMVVVLAFGAYSWQQNRRISQNQHAITVNAWKQCVALNAGVARLNRTFAQLATIEDTNPYKQGALGPRRADVYRQAAGFKVPNCGRKP
jgi:hypothetical protein